MMNGRDTIFPNIRNTYYFRVPLFANKMKSLFYPIQLISGTKIWIHCYVSKAEFVVLS